MYIYLYISKQFSRQVQTSDIALLFTHARPPLASLHPLRRLLCRPPLPLLPATDSSAGASHQRRSLAAPGSHDFFFFFPASAVSLPAGTRTLAAQSRRPPPEFDCTEVPHHPPPSPSLFFTSNLLTSQQGKTQITFPSLPFFSIQVKDQLVV